MKSRDIEYTYQKFVDIEQKYELFDLEIAGLPLWEQVRDSVFQNIFLRNGDDSTNEEVEGEDGVTSGLSGIINNVGLKDIYYIFFKNPLFSAKHDIVYISGRRDKLDDGKWWNIFCDPFCRKPEYDCLHLDPTHYHMKRPLKTDSVLPTRPLRLLGTAAQKVRETQPNISEPVVDHLRAAEGAIFDEFGQQPGIIDRITSRLRFRSRLLPMYELTLKRIDPDIAIVIPSYGGREVFTEACKRQQVPVVELQHGPVNKYHLSYSYPHGSKEMFPDYFFSWGEFWTEQTALPIPEECVFDVGYPIFERRRDAYPTRPTGNRLVVLSQFDSGDYLSRFAVDLHNHPDIDLCVTYKLHPGEDDWRRKYPWLVSSDVEVIGDDGPDLYNLFADARAQVGVYSTALYEGLAYNLTTLLVDHQGVGYMKPIVDKGFAEIVSTPNEVVAKLDSPSEYSIELERLFRPNAVENIEQAIQEVRQEHSSRH